jgi:hypothetical protein
MSASAAWATVPAEASGPRLETTSSNVGRTATVAQHHAMTGRYQMTGEGLGNGAGANGSKVHDPQTSQAFK